MGVKFTVTRMSDGRQFECEHEDRGDTVPAYDETGKPFRAYTSFIKVGDEEWYVQTNAALVEASGHADEFRLQEDVFSLKDQGYEADLGSLHA
jgi:hypothetical protein